MKLSLRKSTAKPRKSTAILITVWLATFVLYSFVKPETPNAPGYTPVANTVLSNLVPDAKEPEPR
ncbi:hypothetical protein [Nocardia sp. NPDC127526]|uniref:hypothetical protein n=1 Tax=Nocardia sp. NPDC127526 TaxID=3345393 RepID=UPI0036254F6A